MSSELKVNAFEVGVLGTNCYIVCGEKECFVVDPGANSSGIIARLEEAGLPVKYILLTHGHFDHIIACPKVRDHSGAKLCLHPEDENLLSDKMTMFKPYVKEPYERPPVDLFLEDGMELPFDGGKTIKVIHTPGHTPGCCVFIIDDLMFSGDTLFKGSVGRCDLEGGNYEVLGSSLKKLCELTEDYKVLPGHGPASTFAFEKANNMYIKRVL